MEWPRFLMFKSLVDNKCLCPRSGDTLCVQEVKELGWHAAHEVVMAKCGGGLVHIKHNGKYWRGVTSSPHYIAVGANEPQENQSSEACTLFQPSIYTKEGVTCIQLQHWRYGKSSFLYLDSSGDCRAGYPTLVIGQRLSMIAVSWVPLMIKYFKDADLELTVSDRRKRLPRFVVFKSAHNNKYLCCDEDGPYFLKFNKKDAMNPNSKHEVVTAKSGYGLVHIKCYSTGKYWRRISEDDHWIAAEADETEEDLSKWSCTLFFLRYDHKEDDNVIQLQHAQLGANTSIFQNCLTTRKSPQITTQKVGLMAFDWESLLPKSPQCPSVGVSNDGIDAKIGGGISVDDINKIVGGLAIEDESNTIIVGGVSIKISEVVYQLKTRFVASSTTSRVE